MCHFAGLQLRLYRKKIRAPPRVTLITISSNQSTLMGAATNQIIKAVVDPVALWQYQRGAVLGKYLAVLAIFIYL